MEVNKLPDSDRQDAGGTKLYVARALPGPDYRLTGSLADARERDRKQIAALKQSLKRPRASNST